MKIQKETFYIVFFLILISAGFMAFVFQDLTDQFIAPTTLSFLGYKNPPAHYYDYFSPDVSFFCFFAIISLAVLRFTHQAEPVVYIIYGASLFFCFFYFFIAPLESFLVLPAFIIPVFLWHQNRINNIVLSFIALLLILFSWWLLQKPLIFLLMLPMCHLFAIRANHALQSRYSSGEVRVLAKLSSTQKKKINPNHSILKGDLWEIIGPEIDALAESWQKARKMGLGEQVETEIDTRKVYKHSNLLSSLLEIQSAGDLQAAMTNLQKRDPGFSQESFLTKFRAAFAKIHQACYDHQIDQIQAMVSDALFEQFSCRVAEQKEAGVRFMCPEVKIHSAHIARLASDEMFDELHVLVYAEAVETAIDVITGETLNAENKLQKICEYWSFVRKPSAKTLDKPGLMEGNCPNCGAPILIGQATVCQVCKSYIRSGSYDWVLSQITQACEWEYANPRLIPGWNDLKASDPQFSIHQIEDRCAVVFWMIRIAEQKRKMEPIIRFATESCCDAFKFSFNSSGKFTFYENVSFASATLKAIMLKEDVERIYLLVVWSGIPVGCTAQGRIPQLHRFSKPRRDVFVFVRKPGGKTNQNNALSSAHCHFCGGPMTSNFAINCNYCNAILNDGSDWILEKIISPESQEYVSVQISKQKLIKKVVEEVKQEQADSENMRSGRDLITMSAQMLLADGRIDDEEMKLLEEYAAKYAMPKDLLNGIIESVKEGEIQLPAPKDRREAHSLMESAIRMALADGEIAAEEQHHIDRLAEKFGYGKADLKMLMRKIENQVRLKKNTRQK